MAYSVVPKEKLVSIELLRHAVQPVSRDARIEGARVQEDVDEDVLSQILGVMRVPGQAVGKTIDARLVCSHRLVPGAGGKYRGLTIQRVGVSFVARL